MLFRKTTLTHPHTTTHPAGKLHCNLAGVNAALVVLHPICRLAMHMISPVVVRVLVHKQLFEGGVTCPIITILIKLKVRMNMLYEH